MKGIKKILSIVLVGIIVGAIPGAADTISWTGQGVTNGQLDDVQCDQGSPYLLWVLTFDHYTIDTPVLHLDGSGSGDYPMIISEGNNAKVQTPFFDLNGLTASATYNVVTTGTGQINLVISHGCSSTEIPEFPNVAMPIAAAMGLLLFFQYRKKKE